MTPSFIQRLGRRRIVRYALVGGLGIPVNNLALVMFLSIFGPVYWLAWLCAFEVSTTVNFVLNQLFTYSEHQLRGWDWPRRALRAQISSSSAALVAALIAFTLKYGFHTPDLVASDVGIIGSFFYNYVVSQRFVFRPTSPSTSGEQA